MKKKPEEKLSVSMSKWEGSNSVLLKSGEITSYKYKLLPDLIKRIEDLEIKAGKYDLIVKRITFTGD
jgi:hypothetical protein